MNLTKLEDIQSLLKKHNLWAKKSLGQNFLIDQNILSQIISAGELSKEDKVLEIGPGLGVLTRDLCQNAKQVISIEKDSKLLPVLQETTAEFENLKILNEDALCYNIPSKSEINSYKIIANIPYYITSPLINHFVRNEFTVKTMLGEGPNLPKIIVLLIQKEVAEKICQEKKYKNKHSVLSLNIHIFGKPEIIGIVPKECFYPSPKVESAIIKINVYDEPKLNPDIQKNITMFFKLIEAGFKNPRKKIHNSLTASGMSQNLAMTTLKQAGIDSNLRPENLEIQDWENLFKYL